MLAYKDLQEEDYEEWAGRRLQASLAQDGREDRLASVYEEMENDMMVQGGTWWGRGGRGRAGRALPGAHASGACGPAAGRHGHRGQASARGSGDHRPPDAGQHQDLGADGRQAR